MFNIVISPPPECGAPKEATETGTTTDRQETTETENGKEELKEKVVGVVNNNSFQNSKDKGETLSHAKFQVNGPGNAAGRIPSSPTPSAMRIVHTAFPHDLSRKFETHSNTIPDDNFSLTPPMLPSVTTAAFPLTTTSSSTDADIAISTSAVSQQPTTISKLAQRRQQRSFHPTFLTPSNKQSLTRLSLLNRHHPHHFHPAPHSPLTPPMSPRAMRSRPRFPTKLFPTTTHVDKRGYLMPPIANPDLRIPDLDPEDDTEVNKKIDPIDDHTTTNTATQPDVHETTLQTESSLAEEPIAEPSHRPRRIQRADSFWVNDNLDLVEKVRKQEKDKNKPNLYWGDVMDAVIMVTKKLNLNESQTTPADSSNRIEYVPDSNDTHSSDIQ